MVSLSYLQVYCVTYMYTSNYNHLLHYHDLQASELLWQAGDTSVHKAHPSTSSVSRSHTSGVSVVLSDSSNMPRNPSIELLDVPVNLTNGAIITMQYCCDSTWSIGVELSISLDGDKDTTVFRKIWHCSDAYLDAVPSLRHRYIEISLPKSLAYRPTMFNKNPLTVRFANLLVWAVDNSLWLEASEDKQYYRLANVRKSYAVNIPHPYDRPVMVVKTCLSWGMEIMMLQPFHPTCPWEPGELGRRAFNMFKSKRRFAEKIFLGW